jgi:hypothetical protein
VRGWRHLLCWVPHKELTPITGYRDVCVLKSHNMDTETQLTSGSPFIPTNVIGTGYFSSTASDNTSSFMMMAGYVSSEEAGQSSLHRLCTFSKSVGFCKIMKTQTI